MSFKRFLAKRSLRARDDQTTRAADMTLRQSLYPVVLVTLLFFLWGFSYGLLDTLNKHFQETLHITKARSSGLQVAYFGAYPLASLGHANWILRHFGYRAVFVWGLCLYALGAIVAIPCIKARSFGGFCAAIFIIGNGLGSLETAANPYITVCGPPKYAEIRINFTQAFNAIGTVVAPVLGSYVLFNFSDAVALRNATWIYLSIACFTFLLALVFLMSVLPEVTDADMEQQYEATAAMAAQTHATSSNTSLPSDLAAGRGGIGNRAATLLADDPSRKPFRRQYRLFHATFAQFCYTGAQIALAGYLINYATEVRPNTDSAVGAKLLAGAQGTFAVGRFVGALAMRFVKPRTLFLAFLTMCIVCNIPAVVLGRIGKGAPGTGSKNIVQGNAAIAMIYLLFFFESVCFPTIMALGMRGLGRHTKRGSGFLVAGVFGGAVVPPLLGYVADKHGTALAFVVPLAFLAAAWSYAFAVNFIPRYRDVADAFSDTNVGIVDDSTVKGIPTVSRS